MEGRTSRLDYHNRRHSAPLPLSSKSHSNPHQTAHPHWSTVHLSSQPNPALVGPPTYALPLRPALKRGRKPHNSATNGERRQSRRDSFHEPSTSQHSFYSGRSLPSHIPVQSNGSHTLISFTDDGLEQNNEMNAPVEGSTLTSNLTSIRIPPPNSRKSNLISTFISKIRKRTYSAPTPHTPTDLPHPAACPRYPVFDIPEDSPTVDIQNSTPLDSDVDVLHTPTRSVSPELPVRKSVRFSVWSHMRTFERPDWEPTGDVYDKDCRSEFTIRDLLRKKPFITPK